MSISDRKKVNTEIILRNIKTIHTYPFNDGSIHIHLNTETTKTIIVLRDNKRMQLTQNLSIDNDTINLKRCLDTSKEKQNYE